MFWQSSSLFRVKFQTKEGAGNGSCKYVNESRHTCRVVNCTWEELNITNLHDCKRVTKQHKSVYLFTSIIKDKTAKARSLRLAIKRVSLVDINFNSFSSGYRAWISRGYRACMLLWKRFTIFQRNLSSESSYFWWKLIDLLFTSVCGVEIKNLQRPQESTFSSRGFAARFRARGYAARACAPTWACLK